MTSETQNVPSRSRWKRLAGYALEAMLILLILAAIAVIWLPAYIGAPPSSGPW